MKRKLLITNIITLVLLISIVVYAFITKLKLKAESEKCKYELVNFNYNHKNETGNPSIIMLGNSLIRGGKWDSLLNRKDVINRGIAGDRLHCICERLTYLNEYSPKICFIEGGINDIPKIEADSLFKNYIQIIAYFNNRKIIPVITCVLRIAPKAGQKFPQVKDYKTVNKEVDELDAKLIAYAKKNSIDYIDLNDRLDNKAKDVLKDEYTIDGIHLNRTAYLIWAGELNAILKKHNI